MKRSREEAEREVGEVEREVREVEKEVREDREAEEAGEDPYGGSTDEAEDMETDVVGGHVMLCAYIYLSIYMEDCM